MVAQVNIFGSVLKKELYIDIGQLQQELAAAHKIREPNFWSDDEVHFIERYWGDKPRRTIAKELNRSLSSVATQARALGLTKSSPTPKEWTPQETATLRKLFGQNMNFCDIAVTLGRTIEAVNSKVQALDLRQQRMNRWTPEQIQYLIETYGKKKAYVLANELGHPVSSVHTKAHVLGLRAMPKDWSPDEVSFLRENYSKLPLHEIASQLNRSAEAVRQRMSLIGIKIQSHRRYSESEIRLLMVEYGKRPNRVLAKEIGRSSGSIKSAAWRWGISCRD